MHVTNNGNRGWPVFNPRYYTLVWSNNSMRPCSFEYSFRYRNCKLHQYFQWSEDELWAFQNCYATVLFQVFPPLIYVFTSKTRDKNIYCGKQTLLLHFLIGTSKKVNKCIEWKKKNVLLNLIIYCLFQYVMWFDAQINTF